ncbi:General secretion pathway protein GspA [Vibrio harveyi]|uniref:ExeA family protein n=1 Tax=Vibrio harveyi TaxID=669 RepID=UPI001EFEA95B|nr:ExeA family protein [Vibrio harveyi]MCG9235351.1 AAA family ATPase [Vibrio harveyi]MCG9587225.1 AAA family ATPase [Vibrio harveyi]CAH1193507.1 General secretion pathway protein GspA [Vibrio harveyi]CAH1548123.1 General secretion pathway protein GspA [Vibrio harveyi]CAH1551837.1 General secretion pathway protein GspA [Vibrio harveyi]
MYKDFFGFVELPFSIVPNSRYLYLSQRHKEAITHLQAGLGDGGGFAMLTGEVGTGKTTVAKAMLANLDENTKAGLILNPTFSSRDLLEAICDEFKVTYPEEASLKQLNQAIHDYLLRNHKMGWTTLLVIDEAQHLAADVLEQLRLLTNLETDTRKLLKVLLVGQPELQRLLQTTQLRQLAQRITGRYHLLPLDEKETADYITFRLHTAGGDKQLFDRSSTKLIAKYSHGIPRLINLICDKSLNLSYHKGNVVVDKQTVHQACEEVMQFQAEIYQQDQPVRRSFEWPTWGSAAIGVFAAVGIGWAVMQKMPSQVSTSIQSNPIQVAQATSQPVTAEMNEQLTSEQRNMLLEQTQSNLAVNELYKLWGYRASVRDNLCLSEPQSIMRCERKMATWPLLVQQNRPVILELNYQGQVGYVLLYAIGNDKVEVLNGSQRLRLPVSWLKPLWQGNIIELWQAPLRETLRLDMEGPAIEVLDTLLAQAVNEQPLGTDIFDAALKERVELFQRWQGIGVDGIAGQRTLERLQQSVQTDAPALKQIKEEGA